MKYMIHACPKRMWYVEEFVIPSMIEQGIKRDDVIVYNDVERKGNLASWIDSCHYVVDNMRGEKGVWHLQDDVLLSKKFGMITNSISGDMVCCGYCQKDYAYSRHKYVGKQKIELCWMSFQCIYIPYKYTKGFLHWFYKECVEKGRHTMRLKRNKYDDRFFWLYITEMHKEASVYNICPNIVQHVDDLIGGSVANHGRKSKNKSGWWVEKELEKELEKALKERAKSSGQTKD